MNCYAAAAGFLRLSVTSKYLTNLSVTSILSNTPNQTIS